MSQSPESFLNPARRGLPRRTLVPASLVGLAGALILLANWIRPYPFSTTDDNWMYFLPLIKAHTDALLGGHPLRVLWGVGAGWSPWENAQVGVLYLPYHLANLLARLLGRPLAILEVSAWLHLAAAGWVTHALAPREIQPRIRLGWSVGAMLMPGPLLLGLNWHNYLSCYPWFLALAFLLRQHATTANPGTPERGDRLALGGVSLGFFLSAHAQMYVLGIGILALWVLAEVPRKSALRTLLPFLFAQLPALVPLVYLKLLALDGTPDWMGDRNDPFYLLRHAQTLGTVLHGTLFGNLLYTRDFQLWANISWVGVGMFFSPFLALLAAPLWRERNWALGVFFIACLAFMGAASIPWIRYFGFGPLEGFRWTWKISIFVGPLALVSLLARLPATRPEQGARIAWGAAGLALAVFLRGLSFEIWPSLDAAHPIGAPGLVAETQRMAQATGLRPGTRLAVLGPFDMIEPLPLPVLGLIGDAATLSGLGTAHIYEPMEPEWVSKAHFGLSLPWRVWVPTQAFLEQPARVMEALRAIGVQALVTIAPQAATAPGSRAYTDSLSRTMWVIPVPGAYRGPYPSGESALTIEGSGVLLAPPSEQPPHLLSPRPIDWVRTARGWRGTPRGLSWGWLLAAGVGGLLTVAGLAWNRWTTLPIGQALPPGVTSADGTGPSTLE